MRGASMGDPGDDRLSRCCTIMGPSGLTAVFGMGTGVAPTVWSPERRPAGVFRPAGRVSVGRSIRHDRWRRPLTFRRSRPLGPDRESSTWRGFAWKRRACVRPGSARPARLMRGGRIGVVKPLGC